MKRNTLLVGGRTRGMNTRLIFMIVFSFASVPAFGEGSGGNIPPWVAISEEQLILIQGLVDQVVPDGHSLLVGGSRVQPPGFGKPPRVGPPGAPIGKGPGQVSDIDYIAKGPAGTIRPSQIWDESGVCGELPLIDSLHHGVMNHESNSTYYNNLTPQQRNYYQQLNPDGNKAYIEFKPGTAPKYYSPNSATATAQEATSAATTAETGGVAAMEGIPRAGGGLGAGVTAAAAVLGNVMVDSMPGAHPKDLTFTESIHGQLISGLTGIPRAAVERLERGLKGPGAPSPHYGQGPGPCAGGGSSPAPQPVWSVSGGKKWQPYKPGDPGMD